MRNGKIELTDELEKKLREWDGAVRIFDQADLLFMSVTTVRRFRKQLGLTGKVPKPSWVEYAFYENEEEIAVGTIPQLAAITGYKESTLKYMTSNLHKVVYRN